MPAGKTICIAAAGPHRILLQLRILPGGGQIEFGWDSDLDNGCTWLLGGQPCDCCEPKPESLEREFWYGRHAGLMQQALYARLADTLSPATVQVHETMYGSYIRNPCKDEKDAEQFSMPAGAAPHYWFSCRKVVL